MSLDVSVASSAPGETRPRLSRFRQLGSYVNPLDVSVLVPAVGLAVLFARVDLTEERRQGIALGAAVAILLSAVVALVLAGRGRARPALSLLDSPRFILASTGALVGVIFVALYGAIDGFPGWSEDIGWREIAREIFSAGRLNPFLAKSDYPSSFNAFPLSLLVVLGFQTSVATKLYSALLLLLSAYFFVLLAREVLGPAKKWPDVVLPMLLATASTFSWFMVVTGWHEITHVNLIIFACWYYAFRTIRDGDRYSAIALGLWSGLAMWTLYTPVLFALPMGLIVLSNIAGTVPIKTRVAFVCWAALMIAPIVGMVVGSSGTMMDRHVLFFLRGGEWGDTQFSGERNPLFIYQATMMQLVHDVLPVLGPLNWDRSARPHSEPVALVLAVVGVAAILWWRRRLLIGGLLLPTLAMFLGLVASNPTPWRGSCLSAGVLGLAIVGIGVVRNIDRKYARLGRAIVVIAAVIHVGVFARQAWFLRDLQNLPEFAPYKGAMAAGYFAQHWIQALPTERILVPDDLPGRIMRADLGWARAKLIRSPADITPQDCTPSCVWMGAVTRNSRWKDSDYEAAFTRLSFRTTKRVLFSRPGEVEVYVLIAGQNLSRNVRHSQ